MTFTSWPDVPAGTPVHWHCLATVEQHHDPARWADASAKAPNLVAWTPQEVAAWARAAMKEHLSTAADQYRQWIEPEVDENHPRWERILLSLSHGRWWMDTQQLGVGRKLVLQAVCFDDSRCCERPAEQTYRSPLVAV